MKKSIISLLLTGLVFQTFAGALPGRKAREDVQEVIVQNNTVNDHMGQYQGDRMELRKQYRNTQRENARQYRNDQRERMSQYQNIRRQNRN